ncbi:hypothetical protein M8J71_01200 [Pseudarthrobacter sp. R1]|uniref:hypothetical protein n=1 Tax=Pseudarthrobacter sp. R1 TaxID=2944934 RepID=UPI00210CE9DD|nr:hypothetical protein [Pseudarthrobacter sp. R1]MCQ6269124.1 hypothetical protein [Pseudarthrobacter sp. R1]
MSEQLFDLTPDGESVPETPSSEPPITESQIQRLRNAFAAAGIDSMDERQRLIESCTIRSVASIRELRARDVRPVLKRIEERANGPQDATGSAWDNRDEDTWIDKL